jgi:hypothetical protein
MSQARMSSAAGVREHAALVAALMQLEFLNVAQAVVVLGVDLSTARRELQKGLLQGKGFKVGREWRVRPSAIRELNCA